MTFRHLQIALMATISVVAFCVTFFGMMALGWALFGSPIGTVLGCAAWLFVYPFVRETLIKAFCRWLGR